MANIVYEAMDYQTGRQRELAQATSRPTRVRFVVEVQGVGVTSSGVLKFPTYILEEPTFSFGVVARTPLKTCDVPNCTAIVTEWRKNDTGMYTGAVVGFRVDNIIENPSIKLGFTLTFEGFALRTTNVIDGGGI